MGKKKRQGQKAKPAEATGDPIQPTSQPTPTQAPQPEEEQVLGATAAPTARQTEPPISAPKPEPELEKKVAELDLRPKIPQRPYPPRPGPLKSGASVPLITNHILLKVGKRTAFHYDIDIKVKERIPERDPNVVDKAVEEEPETVRRQNRFSRKLATKLNREIFKKMVSLYSQTANQVFYGLHPVYDGQKNMFTSRILTGTANRQSITLAVRLEGEAREFQVTIKLAETNSRIDLDILNQYHNGRTCDDEVVKKSVLFINTLLRHNATIDWSAIGQSIFDPTADGQSLGRGTPLLLMYGFYTSVRNLMIGPTLNVDRSAGCFYDTKLTLTQIIGMIINADLERIPGGSGDAPVLNDWQRRKIGKELKGIQIEAMHHSYGGSYHKYRILGISRESARTCRFDWNEKEGQTERFRGNVTVQQYFRMKYNRELRYPHLPVLEVGNPRNPAKLPMEICRIATHQRLRRSMTNNERQEMTRISGQMSPANRFQYCENFVDKQFFTGPMANQNRPYLTEFSIDINTQFLEVESKVIPPPTLKYSKSKTNGVKPRDGEWEMYKNDALFLKPAILDKWIVINMSFRESFQDRDLDGFVNDLRNQAKEMGMGPMPVGPTAPITKVLVRDRNFNLKTQFAGIKNNLDKMASLKGLKMILFITPTKRHDYSDEIYAEIKHLGDVQQGLTTQCVNIDSIWNDRDRRRKWNRSYLRQLMLKVNPKLGGVNVALLDNSFMSSIVKSTSLMIVGADVNHPAPADKVGPSIAALVGSYDQDFTKYYTNVTMQPKSREEMIKRLDDMMIDLLRYYRTQNRQTLPQQIIFYRDGVSEGQFQHVIDNEYVLLANAFKKIDPKYKPKLTFIVVQKRHHTRFMVKQTGRNVDPGTVVEKSVTHKNDFDFYLCSHAGRIGTSRAAHYYVLADENHFNSDDMCRITYYLCHLYQRCTKSVSIPAPVYYADLAAYRAKVLASTIEITGSDTTSVRSGAEFDLDSGNGRDDERHRERQERQIRSYTAAIAVNASQKERLYYC